MLPAMEDRPASPCDNTCFIHPHRNICVGCLRSLEEIAGWGSMTAQEQRALLAELPAREKLIRKRSRLGTGNQGRGSA